MLTVLLPGDVELGSYRLSIVHWMRGITLFSIPHTKVVQTDQKATRESAKQLASGVPRQVNSHRAPLVGT